jgi:hypothetical protein
VPRECFLSGCFAHSDQIVVSEIQSKPGNSYVNVPGKPRTVNPYVGSKELANLRRKDGFRPCFGCQPRLQGKICHRQVQVELGLNIDCRKISKLL